MKLRAKPENTGATDVLVVEALTGQPLLPRPRRAPQSQTGAEPDDRPGVEPASAPDACDELTWQLVADLVLARLPHPPATIIDCSHDGSGWAPRLTGLGHRVLEVPVDTADLNGLLPGTSRGADLVLALGSLPSAPDPAAALARITRWLRPGGHVVARAGSLVGAAQERLDAGDPAGAVRTLETRRSTQPVSPGIGAPLLDAAGLRRMALLAGLESIRVHGLLVSWSSAGPGRVQADLALDRPAMLAAERELALEPDWADLGQQLLLVGQIPAAAHRAPRWIAEPGSLASLSRG